MRFCKRKSISSRAITHIAQKDTRTTQEQQDIVVSFFAELDSSIHFYEKRAIVNMDETPVYFDMVQSRTLSERGAKSVDLNTTGNDKMRFTVALTITASGSCLPQFVLFRNLVKAPKCENKSSMVTMQSSMAPSPAR